MTVLKQYNTSTAVWETIVVGQPGEAGIVNGTVAPADTSVLWLDTADAESQVAIPAGGTAGQILAKTTGTDYATGWVDNPGSRNAVINGGFDIWQRGNTFNPSGAWTYVADRWRAIGVGSGFTRAVTRETFTPGVAPVAGYEGAHFLKYNQSVAGTGNVVNHLETQIEDVRTFAGQTITLSFWAKAASNITLDNIKLMQDFGGVTAVVDTNFVTSLAIGTSWTRYTFTINAPSIAGKSFNANSYIGIRFNLPLNSVFNFDLWGVQLEAGSVATPFKRNGANIADELVACQRYYVRFNSAAESAYAYYGTGHGWSTTNSNVLLRLPVTMRTSPTSLEFATISNYRVYDGPNSVTLTGLTLDGNTTTRDMAMLNTTVSSGLTTTRAYSLTNNNVGSAFIGISAELN
jgi:hypothetical protein